MIFQKRSTGGIYIRNLDEKYIIDPGPGTLTMMKRIGLNPTKIDGILVSHAHPDHSTNVEVLIEAMTKGGRKKRGVLVGSESVINGTDDIDPVVSPHFLDLVERYDVLKPGMKFALSDDANVRATPSDHTDPTTIGFVFDFKNHTVRLGYVSDTQWHPGLIRAFEGCDVLIVANTRPLGMPLAYHLSTEDTLKLASEVRPYLLVLTHLGIKMLEANPIKEARWIEAQCHVWTMAAVDGMSVYMDSGGIRVRNPEPYVKYGRR